MSEDCRFFEIQVIQKVLKLTNHSKLRLIMSDVPVKPKRKYKALRIVPPKSFIIFDFDEEFDMSTVSFRFEHV